MYEQLGEVEKASEAVARALANPAEFEERDEAEALSQRLLPSVGAGPQAAQER